MQDFWTSLGRGFHELFRYAYPGFLFLLLVKLIGIEIPVFKMEIPGTSTELWSLIIFALIVGFIVYNFHRFFIYEYILLFLFAYEIHAAGYKCKMEGKMPPKKYIVCILLSLLIVISFICLFIVYFESGHVILKVILGGLLIASLIFHVWRVYRFMHKSNYLSYERIFVKKRFSKVTKGKDKQSSSENGFSNYMLNRWASAHAIGMTFWLPVLMYWYASGFPSRNGIIFKHQSIFWIAIGIFLFAWFWQVITLSIIEREFGDS